MRGGHAHMEPVALTTLIVSGILELDLLKRVLPVALRGTAAQWLHLQPPFLSWDNFMAALRVQFLPVDHGYRVH
ncbi:hypothetical protein HPB52_013358 [Rhipicephalus sanguineus]|uniref:Uncharacterized protein n=1 Tax=Rhipicephalus sanguineus TaxID=34632 RepID=A0A9D4PE53_RHISA|nr:hypothetical protein HPB52_013358 [Rhipicephalus sanguineus]